MKKKKVFLHYFKQKKRIRVVVTLLHHTANNTCHGDLCSILRDTWLQHPCTCQKHTTPHKHRLEEKVVRYFEHSPNQHSHHWHLVCTPLGDTAVQPEVWQLQRKHCYLEPQLRRTGDSTGVHRTPKSPLLPHLSSHLNKHWLVMDISLTHTTKPHSELKETVKLSLYVEKTIVIVTVICPAILLIALTWLPT